MVLIILECVRGQDEGGYRAGKRLEYWCEPNFEGKSDGR
jgi:hypothetical protein